MGLFDKFKNIFTEEVEDEEVKKEVRQVEIVSPKELEEETKEEVKEEVEEKFVFPVYFDDKDFEELTPKKEEVKIEPPKKEIYGIKTKEVKEVKKFTPSPIISPVYGVLDKNYNSADIVSKTNISRSEYKSVNRSLDEVRKRAYGTLEDELENSLFSDDPIYTEKEIKEENIKDTSLTEDLFDQINEVKPVEQLENKIIDDYKPKNTEIDDNMTLDALNSLNEDEDLDMTSSDLFNLIDSMYEKDDENGDI